MTLLFRLRGQAGLEIQTAPGGAWAPVPVCPPGTESDPEPPVLVNIGDLLSFWTNGLLRSTVHRVVFGGGSGANPTDPRYSIAYFCHPADTTPLAPVPSERIRQSTGGAAGAGIGQVLTAEEHLQSRLRATYQHLSTEGQDQSKSGV